MRVVDILFLELVILIDGRPLVSSTHVWATVIFGNGVILVTVLVLCRCNCTWFCHWMQQNQQQQQE